MKNYSQKIRKILNKEIDPAYVDRAEIILSEMATRKKVLEIGCGRGFYLKALNEINSEMNITGVDLNEKYLKVAREYINNKKIKITSGDATNLKFENDSFDGVVASEILEHIPDDKKALKEIERILKPGGKVIISVPNKNYPFLWDPLNWTLERLFKTHVSKNIWWLAGIWADQVRLYGEEDLVKKIKNSGLDVKKIWRTTKYCWPFSHFLFYGIGKNLVEMGILKNFNRFEKNKEVSGGLKMVKKIINLIDKKNNREFTTGERTTNLVVLAQK